MITPYTTLDYTDLICTRVTVQEAAERYLPGVRFVRGRIPCPFHNGHDNNFSVRDTMYHCFVCGESGDVIRFVSKMFNCSRYQAAAKLNEDFALGLPFGRKYTLREMQNFNKDFQKFLARQKAEREAEQAKVDEYHAAFDLWILYDKWQREYAPKDAEHIDARYVMAVKNIARAADRLDSILARE